MSSVKWAKHKGGKKGAFAMFRHSDSEYRKTHNQSNKDINKQDTDKNISYGIFKEGYEAEKKLYAEMLDEIQSKPNANKRKDAVTLLEAVYTAPKGMDTETAIKWGNRVNDILEYQYGDNYIGGTFHVDEIHQYRDPKTKKMEWSRCHGHAFVIPEVDGKLNAKRFLTASHMKKLNEMIQEMTVKEFPPYIFMDGSQKKSKLTTEDLKRQSDVAEYEAEQHARIDSYYHAVKENIDEQLRKANDIVSNIDNAVEDPAGLADFLSELELTEAWEDWKQERLRNRKAEQRKRQEVLTELQANFIERFGSDFGDQSSKAF